MQTQRELPGGLVLGRLRGESIRLDGDFAKITVADLSSHHAKLIVTVYGKERPVRAVRIREGLEIFPGITVYVSKIQGSQVRLLFSAPKGVKIMREELLPC